MKALVTMMPAKRVAPRPKVEGEGNWNDVLCKRLDPIKVSQLILDPEVIVFNIITLIILIIEIIFPKFTVIYFLHLLYSSVSV